MARKVTSLILCLCLLFCLCACTFEEKSSELVWIPTKEGVKYHKKQYCSNMKDPVQVTKETAIKNGFEPCKNCY